MSPIVIPELLGQFNFADSTELFAHVAADGSWQSLTGFVVNGLSVVRDPTSLLFRVQRYVGERNVPGDIRRLRASTDELMRRMGQPVIVKHMYNAEDVKVGLAQPSPNLQPAYGQTRSRDPFSYGVGFCSLETNPREWIDPNSGAIITSDISPGSDFVNAPMYRGYGPGFLTYLIEPDVALDVFKISQTGALIKVQSQKVVASWFPEIGDNDLIINVMLDNAGHVVDGKERYQAKMASPVTIRGLDRRGRREGNSQLDLGNRFAVNQTLEMSRVPSNATQMLVEVDR